MVPMIGYRTGTVEYERGERFAGESKYPLKKMLSFAMEGITSLSVKPIRYITGLGFLIFAVSILMLIYSIVLILVMLATNAPSMKAFFSRIQAAFGRKSHEGGKGNAV